MIKNDWKIEYNPPVPSPELAKSQYSELLQLVLALKGLNTVKEADSFLNPGQDVLHDPFDIRGMRQAVDRIGQAISESENVAVYGDYDVDGITATCLVTDYLTEKGLKCRSYIPDRSEEGYGLNKEALNKLKQEGITLVITVDCGITAVDEVNYASDIGLDMIITDHHECMESGVPDRAVAVIDCKQAEDFYANKSLAGVGVALKLVCACEGNQDRTFAEHSDLAAIGTIADVMPLTGENRYIVKTGLEQIRRNPRPGIKAIIEVSEAAKRPLDAALIGYSIAPKLNAAGRLDKTDLAVDLVRSTDSRQADEMARILCELNKERQKIGEDIFRAAEAQLVNYTGGPIVLSGYGWHQGVIGIVASRLAEKYCVPAIMISIPEGETIGKGSCRSYGDFNLYEALTNCKDLLTNFGGHALAAGLKISSDNIDSFRSALREYYDRHKPTGGKDVVCDLLILEPDVLTVDNLKQKDDASFKALDSLEPFGNGNSKPVMCITDAEIVDFRDVGGGKHLKLTVRFDWKNFDCIFFSHNSKEFNLSIGQHIDIAFTPNVNEYPADTQNVQLLISAIRPHDPTELCRLIIENGSEYAAAASRYRPARAAQAAAWRYIEKNGTGSTIESIISECPPVIENNIKRQIKPEEYCCCIAMFNEAGLIFSDSNLPYNASPAETSRKADLNSLPFTKAMDSWRNRRGQQFKSEPN